MDHGDPRRDPSSGQALPEQGDSSFLVRPYTISGGRTRPRVDVAIESVVSSVPYLPRDVTSLTPEYQSIIGLCRGWRSVAEVSALLRLPLGVTRVLIADMAHEGLLRLHQSNAADRPTDVRLLERVLSGLRKL
jgi:hypothetical protein